MENCAGSSGNMPYPSKLKELLTSDRTNRRAEIANGSNTGTLTGDRIGPKDRQEMGKRMSNTSESSNGGDNGESSEEGASCMKKTPLILTFKRICAPAPFSETRRAPEPFTPDPVQFPTLKEAFCLTKSNIVPDISVAREQGTVKVIPKPPKDKEHMQAEIDKLLSMPMTDSWKNRGKKDSRRQRKHQCSECSKSYSTEEDLKIHQATHTGPKKYQCDKCDKSYKVESTLIAHREAVHNHSNDDTQSLDNSQIVKTQGKTSPTYATPEPVVPKTEDVDKEKPNEKNDDSDTSPRPNHTSVPISNGLTSAVVIKSTPPRRAAVRESPTTRASRSARKGGSATTAESQKTVSNESKKRGSVVTEEAEDSPQTPSSRSSLRRNIQRPRWLQDSDLVTDYEFPRGTNSVRMAVANTSNDTTGGSTSQSTPVSTPTANGHAQSRRISAESLGELYTTKSPRQPKSDKVKVLARDKKISDDTVKTDAKKDPVKAVVTETAKKPIRREKGGQGAKSPIKSKLRPKKAVVEGIQPVSPSKETVQMLDAVQNALGIDQITRVSNAVVQGNSQETNDEVVKVDTKSEKKEAKKRKRAGSEGRSEKASTPRASKRKRLSDAGDKTSETSNSKAARKKSLTTDQIMSAVVSASAAHISGTTATTDNGDIMQVEDLKTELKGPQGDEGQDPAKCIETDTISSDHELEKSKNNTSEIIHSPTVDETHVGNIEVDAPTKNSEGETLCSVIEPHSSVSERTPGAPDSSNAQHPPDPISVKVPFTNFEAISFADIARGKTLNVSSELSAKTVDGTEKDLGPEVVDLPRDHLINSIIGNDEDMPVLRPETSSSTAASRSDSFAERMQSIDEDVSSNSNHSTLPPAPVLNKELAAATTFANGIQKGSPDKSTVTTGQGLIVLADEVDNVTSENIVSVRGRSDSLSVHSCGSGSQSDKIKTLDDVSIHGKDELSNPDLAESEFNDTHSSDSSDCSLDFGDADIEKYAEDCIRFVSSNVSASTIFKVRKELKRLKKDSGYLKLGRRSPFSAGLMHDLFCQELP